MDLVLTTVIACFAVLSFLLLAVNALLNFKIDPVKENQSDIKEQLEKRMNSIENKLDQLIAAKNA